MTDNITIRLLTPSDIYPEMLESFNHKQIISNKWVKMEIAMNLQRPMKFVNGAAKREFGYPNTCISK